ncbi:reverse transcriptase domain-containing protein [Rhizobium sp. R634]|uniref:reverse transcriptase domain-containing protein n=1 Tax=Rhizobium sp. R634 TaxID=1764274 RepID=UPI001FD9A534|nr:reverse transcriptase domain-containing protein [Rhizobium sp. R634]
MLRSISIARLSTMPLSFENFLYSYNKNGKPIYAPNPFGEKLGAELKRKVNKAHKFDSFVYHFKDGSHVLALHRHRNNQLFCRIDISKFFYSIQRNRVKRVLKDIHVQRPEYYAKWSTVKNPYGAGYVLPYGFVQSPILATLVLAKSPIGVYLRALPASVTVSVYMDDICLSGNDEAELKMAFDGLVAAVAEAGFTLNDDKTRAPASQIDIFNCSLTNGKTEVLQDRVDEFFAEERSPASEEGFKTYCDIVESKTWRTGHKKKRRTAYFRSLPKPTPVAPAAPEPPTT